MKVQMKVQQRTDRDKSGNCSKKERNCSERKGNCNKRNWNYNSTMMNKFENCRKKMSIYDRCYRINMPKMGNHQSGVSVRHQRWSEVQPLCGVTWHTSDQGLVSVYRLMTQKQTCGLTYQCAQKSTSLSSLLKALLLLLVGGNLPLGLILKHLLTHSSVSLVKKVEGESGWSTSHVCQPNVTSLLSCVVKRLW